MLMLCAIVGGLLCFTCFLFIVVHPLVCILECTLSKRLSGSQKALWIAMTLVTGAFGSLAYAFFGGASPKFRSMSLNGLKLATVNLILAICVFAATPEVRGFFNAQPGSWAEGSWAEGSWAEGSWAEGSWAEGDWSDGALAFAGENGFDIDEVTGQFQSAMTEVDAALSASENLSQEADTFDAALEAAFADDAIEPTAVNDSRELFAVPGQQYVKTASEFTEDQPDLSTDNSDLFAMLAEEGDIDPQEIESEAPATSTLQPEDLQTLGLEATQPEQQTPSTTEQPPVEHSLMEAFGSLFQSDDQQTRTSATVVQTEATASAAESNRAESNRIESRNTKPVTLAKPTTTPKPKGINRYRLEGYPVYQVTQPQATPVRNRYTNQ